MAITPNNNLSHSIIYMYMYIFVRVHAHLGVDMRCAWGLHTRKSDIVMLKVHKVVHNDYLSHKYNEYMYSDIVYVMMAVHVL